MVLLCASVAWSCDRASHVHDPRNARPNGLETQGTENPKGEHPRIREREGAYRAVGTDIGATVQGCPDSTLGHPLRHHLFLLRHLHGCRLHSAVYAVQHLSK